MTDSTQPTPCPGREEALALHAGRDLPPAEARVLEAHLGSCPGCRGFLEELEESRGALIALTAETPAAAGLADLHRRVMEEVRSAESPRRGLSHRRWVVAAMVMLALATALVWRLGPDTSQESPGEEHVWVARGEAPESPEPPSISPTPDLPVPETMQPESTPPDSMQPEPTPREPRPTAPTHETEIRRASTDDRPDLKIQLVSDDPDIVIYWLVDMEEPADVPTTAPSTT